MKRNGTPKVKGVFERPVGSGCWWIDYHVEGKRHREKVGRKSDALALYQKRKADARRKVKLPELVRGKTVTFGQLSEMAVKYAETHLASPDLSAMKLVIEFMLSFMLVGSWHSNTLCFLRPELLIGFRSPMLASIALLL